MKHTYTIKKSDIGKRQLTSSRRCHSCGMLLMAQCIDTQDFMGAVLPIDVGKRIYLNNGVYQVENNEQLKERKAKNEC